MRIDVVTIFPEYLDALRLSLVGRAVEAGVLALGVHDLRDWTTDRHHTVDDTPLGGGAGMVMKPDVWGRALEDILALGVSHCGPEGRTVLAIPTPSGERLDQRRVEDLAGADHLVIACGRYEGIDARVAEHYARRVEVLEYSIGDYVLNGGEAAALVLVEAVARLLPGVVGNPESLAEESHGAAGLLEYPVYTRPPLWRGLAVPDILLSGHHARIARWRRDRALERTAARRPDMVAALTAGQLERGDREVLARLGWAATAAGPRPLTVRHATGDDVAHLAELAAETFPLACPDHLPAEDVIAFVRANLSPARFREYLADPERYLVLVAELDGELAGYTLSVLPRIADEPPYAADVEAVVTVRPVAELSKIYVREAVHGSGISQALMDATLAALAARTVEGRRLVGVWLGTNARNRRAHRFYARTGWERVGTRHFTVGGRVEDDAVFLRRLVATPY
ncbi:MAG: tRNA (guanosine(37)-N1)-methyltransferase TrmD [Actinomycetes bacterium]|nr:tRNA (guanosine(37)-N1)-methyltransferase TrmD [Actinomycetes bacterium]MDX5380202.1 tRNA (guanosine(37)-N1)-methyltransferase TrmD [Actinomycetes bacterium]MDX5398879.1 tRNA (guanosine(37)-N1)-methyltransferase TrmD [Actinomycetes bacterium]MDX5449926.1 tRNA (guanosine(37)-N1)-methyltransferase TrmD [Actinomycetes bacterium]